MSPRIVSVRRLHSTCSFMILTSMPWQIPQKSLCGSRKRLAKQHVRGMSVQSASRRRTGAIAALPSKALNRGRLVLIISPAASSSNRRREHSHRCTPPRRNAACVAKDVTEKALRPCVRPYGTISLKGTFPRKPSLSGRPCGIVVLPQSYGIAWCLPLVTLAVRDFAHRYALFVGAS